MKKLFILSTIIPSLYGCYDTPPYIKGHTTFSIRSQSTNGALKTAGTHSDEYRYKQKSFHGNFTLSSAFSHSMRSEQIARSLFGSDTFTISGSEIINRGTYDLLADYFGLAQTYQGTVEFVPRIATAQVIFNNYMGYDQWIPGLYTRVYAPFVWTRWNMHINENVTSSNNTTPFIAGYMDQAAVVPPIQSFKQGLNGTVTFGQMQEPLQYGKIECPLTKHGFSDVQITLGYNPYRSWRGHAGCGIFLGIPTGTRVKAEYLFSPQIGNGRHWECGAEFTGHATLWEKDGNQNLDFYANITMSHLFAAKQQRSFDIKTNRNLSRYMLVKIFDESKQYTGTLSPLINKTTLYCHVHTNLQFDIVALLSYTNNTIVCDLGYNGWIRTQERISLENCFDENSYGLKGIQNVVILPNTLSTITQNNATIYGNEFLSSTDQIAVADEFSPVLLTSTDLDISSAEQPRDITHKIFAHIGYRWSKNAIKPLLGIGGEIEFEGENRRKTYQEYRHTLSLWSIWIKGGLEF